MSSSVARLCARSGVLYTHCPLKWFLKRNEHAKAALIILNYKLFGLDYLIRNYWDHFSVVACADGGSNVLHDIVDKGSGRYIPNVVCGDMDSARPSILDLYESKGCSIIKSSCQDTTDFTKTLIHLTDLKKSGKFEFSAVYVLNGIGGRFDQTLANINTLYSARDDDAFSLYLMSEQTISFVLKPGSHSIDVKSNFEEGHCGLIPLGEPCKSCTTSGLQWNLENDQMELGGLISTNNLIAPNYDEVKIQNTNTLLWTMSHTLLDQPV